MKNWPDHLISLCVFLILASLILMFYGQANNAKMARCDNPEFAKNPEHVQYCQAVKVKH